MLGKKNVKKGSRFITNINNDRLYLNKHKKLQKPHRYIYLLIVKKICSNKDFKGS